MNKESRPISMCPLAWEHSFVNSRGQLELCCISEGENGSILGDSGNALNMSDGIPYTEVLNTKHMKEIRLKMLKGEWSSSCLSCKLTEDMGGVSRRVKELQQTEHTIDSLKAITDEDGSTLTSIKSIDYRLGNYCNLKCRMCSPLFSSKWMKDYLDDELVRDRAIETFGDFSNNNWVDSDELLDDFLSKLPTLEIINFAGGEPLINSKMLEILELCVSNNKSKNIILSYNTNLTVLPQKVLELWKEFKEVKLFISIDGYDQVNSYIRPPSRWESIHKNMLFIDQNFYEHNITFAEVNSTVQALNIFHLNELFIYLFQFKFIKPVPNIVNLTSPLFLQSRVLPKKVKILVYNRLNGLKNRLDEFDLLDDNHRKEFVARVDHVLKFMRSSDLFEAHYSQFLEAQKEFDDKYESSLFEIIPLLRHFSTKY